MYLLINLFSYLFFQEAPMPFSSVIVLMHNGMDESLSIKTQIFEVILKAASL